eukprot:TRINITY_DN102806_c0_g1_i1.p1 TRINITY_DN102806_c0_g1~~TRINITY_DN102806_c0_g1_i1.p1  ORF type:complete len:384 (-),score=20.59 TRINITY_DN102806_c0_g1_i1:726-1877(-)
MTDVRSVHQIFIAVVARLLLRCHADGLLQWHSQAPWKGSIGGEAHAIRPSDLFVDDPTDLPEEVYVVLSDESDRYVPGIQALAASLIQSKASRPLVAAVVGRPSRSLQRTADCLGLRILRLRPLPFAIPNADAEASFNTVCGFCWNKISLWALPVKRIVALASDTLVLKNVDGLFATDKHFMAVAMFAGMAGCSPWIHVNTDVLTFSPSVNTLYRMFDLISSGQQFRRGDETFFTSFFSKEIFNSSCCRLPYTYNVPSFKEVGRQIHWPHVHILHFVGIKPWSRQDYTTDNSHPESHHRFWEKYVYWEALYNQCRSKLTEPEGEAERCLRVRAAVRRASFYREMATARWPVEPDLGACAEDWFSGVDGGSDIAGRRIERQAVI